MAQELAREDDNSEREYLQKRFNALCRFYNNLPGDRPSQKRFSMREPPSTLAGIRDEGVFKKYCTQWCEWKVIERFGNPQAMNFRFACDPNMLDLDEVQTIHRGGELPRVNDESEGEVVPMRPAEDSKADPLEEDNAEAARTDSSDDEDRAAPPPPSDPPGNVPDNPVPVPCKKERRKKRKQRVKDKPATQIISSARLVSELRTIALNLLDQTMAEQTVRAVNQLLQSLTPIQLELVQAKLGIYPRKR